MGQNASSLFALTLNSQFICAPHNRWERGEVTEWLKVHAWKACVLQKGTQGSNPCLSAERKKQLKITLQ